MRVQVRQTGNSARCWAALSGRGPRHGRVGSHARSASVPRCHFRFRAADPCVGIELFAEFNEAHSRVRAQLALKIHRVSVDRGHLAADPAHRHIRRAKALSRRRHSLVVKLQIHLISADMATEFFALVLLFVVFFLMLVAMSC